MAGKNLERFFIGIATTARPDWETFFSEPVATRSEKPESKAAEVLRKKADRAAKAGTLPFAATLTEAVVLGSSGTILAQFTQSSNAVPGYVAVNLFHCLQQNLDVHIWAVDGRATDGLDVRMFGLAIRDIMRLAVLDALRYAAETKTEVVVPAGLWYHRHFEPGPWVDPYEALVPAEQRNDISVDGLLRYLGLQPRRPSETAGYRAEVAWLLAQNARLYPLE